MFIKLWYEFTKMLFNKLTLIYPWCLMANEENYSWSEIRSSYELKPCMCDFILVEEYYIEVNRMSEMHAMNLK